MKNKLTTDQQTKLAGIHSKASDILTQAGFSCIRQFTPVAGQAGESFEVWAKNGQAVFVQFYAEAHGVEFYSQMPSSTWAGSEKQLRELFPQH